MRTVALAIFFSLLLIQPILAQTVDEANALVFYFDEEATQRSWYGTGEVTVYLMAGPLFFEGQPCQVLNSWDCWSMAIYPLENVSGAVLTMRGNAEPAVMDLGALGFLDCQVQLLEPLPLAERTVLAELVVNVVSTEPTALEAWGGNFTADGNPNWFEQLTSGPDGPMDMTGHTATINGDAPVSTESLSLDQLKALYR